MGSVTEPNETPAVDRAPLLERAFELELEERAYRIEGIEGQVPEWLRGTYYINGPGRFRRGDLRYRHWLDGDGQVVSLRFGADGVHFRNRFVRTAKLEAETEAGRALYRTFGTSFEGDRLMRGISLESPANVSVWRFADTLLAFGEQGLPMELDPETLETRGLYTFGGQLNAISPLSAHPCFDPDTGEMYQFGTSFSARQPSLRLYRFGADGETLFRRRVAIERPVSTHDFILGPRHLVFYMAPYLLDVEAVMSRGKSIMEALSWQPELGSHLLIFSREDGAPVGRVEVPTGYCLHLVNAFEHDRLLHVDLVELDRPIYDQYQPIPNLFSDVAPGRPVRFIVDLAAKRLVDQVEMAYDRAPDFPSIDGRLATRAYRHFWMLGISATGQPGRKFFDELVHLDWGNLRKADLYRARPGCYLGCEPIFLGHPEKVEEGVVLTKEFDAEAVRDTYLLFDARAVAQGPIARLPLDSPVPAGFHASFEPDGP